MEGEKRLLAVKTIIVAIRVYFGEHIYEFKGELFTQLVGGLIGVKLTGKVASIIMDRWA